MKNTLPLRVRFDAFELDLKSGELHKSGQLVVLQDQPLQILRMLIEHAGAITTLEEIQQQLWPNDTGVEFDRSIDAAIKKLLFALGDSADNPKYIETVAHRGYRLLPPVERVESNSSDALTGVVSSSHDVTGGRVELEPAGLTGQTFSQYRVLGIVGSGGMGVVYEAEDSKLGRRVALKFLPQGPGHDARALERFEREARAASALEHPNICPIYQFGEHEGQPFIVMQLLRGQTLKGCLAAVRNQGPASPQAKALPLDQVLDMAIQIADGLEAAHEKGIIHRDIKPANIFLTDKGVVKILDFGLAKLLQSSAQEGVDQSAFSATATQLDDRSRWRIRSSEPEAPAAAAAAAQELSLSAPGVTVDAQTDLFSFGLVLYEIATGQRAFSGPTAEILHQEILNGTAAPARGLNPELPSSLEKVIHKAMEKDRGLRYQRASEIGADLNRIKLGIQSRERAAGLRRKLLATVAVVLIAAIAGGLYWRSRKSTTLTDKDTIVLADFTNTTGDSVFDDTLKQGLSVQLQQSPFLDLISESKVNQTLKLMGRPAGDRLTPEVTREVCQRTRSKAMLTGSIAGMGSQYVIGLKAVNCNTGDSLAAAQEQAAGKEAVLKALDRAAISLRGKLGESLSSVQKYATPLEEATTPSLEALKAYSQGRKTSFAKGETAALPFYKRTVELDPNFALAYATISGVYLNLNEAARAAENAGKAYELRERVSERERFSIEAFYYVTVTGELEKAAQVCELWQQTYPRDDSPFTDLGFILASLGNWEKVLEEARQAMRLEPNDEGNYVNLVGAYLALNRLDEAEATYKQVAERKLESEGLLQYRYQVAFHKGDAVQMAHLVSAAMGKPGTEDLLLASQADTEGWYGKLKNARELTRRAMDSAQHNDAKETAATYQAAAALREVESGNLEQARADTGAAVKLAPNRDVRAMTALALARAGDMAGADKLAAKLDKTFPLGTQVQRYWLPTIRAAVALQRKDPNRAVQLLQVASTIELGQPMNGPAVYLCPVYLRGEAYLMLHDGNAAAVEFQKFIDHRGVVVNFPWGALARLGLARAYALSGDTGKAKTAYQDFLTLWKDADPDIPIYRQAKAEYAKLQ
jgi:serine/threonine protein kinase/tetratricopeptide (TPR) repeat protein